MTNRPGIAKQILYMVAPYVAIVGVTLGVMYLTDPVSFVAEPRTPEQRAKRVALAPAALPPLASATVECFPVLTDDASAHAIERCDRQGGYTSHGWAYVDCWQGRPHDDASHLLWHYDTADAALDDERSVK